MSIFGAMRTSVSGMNAQGNRISTYSENIANSSTTGYKQASTEFSTMLISQNLTAYTSGGVDTRVRYRIDEQGILQNTTSPTDVAIQGQGFFVVADPSGAPHLTRAGSFVQDAQGYLVNAAGYRLMGATGANSASVGYSGLTPIKIDAAGLVAVPSSAGTLSANVPSSASIVAAANLPSTNSATATYSAKTSLVAYNNLGEKTTYDVYMTKTGANAWEAAVYDHADASASGGFPYANPAANVTSLTFDPANGKLLTPNPGSLSVTVPGGATVPIDISSMTQLGAPFTIVNATIDGSAPSQFSQLRIEADGTVSAVYQNGTTAKQAQIMLANVPSENNLAPSSGNVFDVTDQSGAASVGSPGNGSMGALVSGALENSTVDVATELTGMIETQRAYTANSKAFQVASDITDVIVNLKV